MKYKIDRKKLEEGAHELMKDSYNKLEETTSKNLLYLHEVKRIDNSSLDFFKDLTKKSFKVLIRNYEDLRDVAKKYISTEEYDEKSNQLIKEKIKELENIKWNPKY